MRRPYATDISDEGWEVAKLYIPEAVWIEPLQKALYERREILNAILYREKTGCQWRNLPHDFPPWRRVYDYYSRWRDDGTFDRLHDALRERVRAATPHADGSPRAAQAPTACALDSQSVKTTEEARSERGYDAGKKVKGRKRHLVVDLLGLVLIAAVTSASVQDRDTGTLLVKAKREFASLQVGFVDGGYRGQCKQDVESKTDMCIEITLRSDAQRLRGFVPLPKRWVVERTFGWLNRYRLLSKGYERLISSDEADVKLCMSQVMLRRLFPA